MFRQHHAKLARQTGTSAVEFTLVAIPMLLAGLGAVEISRWFFVKQAISLALLEAGRAGITNHGRPTAIEAAFERGLLPLFPATSQRSAAQRLQQAFDQRFAATGTVPWQIRVQNPNPSVFHDFAVNGLTVAGASGLATIDNNYQAEQHERYKQQGRVDGRGAVSGATIFEANNLNLHLSYMHEPVVPGMRALLQLLSTGSSGYAQQALAGGYLPLRHTMLLTMQSHPVAWPSHNLKVLTAEQAAASPASTTYNLGACRGLWCPNQTARIASAPPPSNASSPPSGTNSGNHPPATPQPPGTPDSAGLPGADDALCGVVLCCVGS